MCLIITRDQANIITKNDDIEVYKVIKLKGYEMESLYEGYLYSLTDVMIANDFDSTVYAVEELKNLYYRKSCRLYYGFHSFTNEFCARSHCYRTQKYASYGLSYANVTYRVAKFIIPRQTSYIIGQFDDYSAINYLSHALKFVKLMD